MTYQWNGAAWPTTGEAGLRARLYASLGNYLVDKASELCV
jgi:hypothetical protein